MPHKKTTTKKQALLSSSLTFFFQSQTSSGHVGVLRRIPSLDNPPKKKNTPRNPLQRHKPAKEAHQFFDARHRRRASDPRTATRKTAKKTPQEVLESRSTATRARTACATF